MGTLKPGKSIDSMTRCKRQCSAEEGKNVYVDASVECDRGA
jgi:hypothetical protein